MFRKKMCFLTESTALQYFVVSERHEAFTKAEKYIYVLVINNSDSIKLCNKIKKLIFTCSPIDCTIQLFMPYESSKKSAQHYVLVNFPHLHANAF